MTATSLITSIYKDYKCSHFAQYVLGLMDNVHYHSVLPLLMSCICVTFIPMFHVYTLLNIKMLNHMITFVEVSQNYYTMYWYMYSAYAMICVIFLSMFSGEQPLLLARRGGGGDGVWEVEGETGASQQSW